MQCSYFLPNELSLQGLKCLILSIKKLFNSLTRQEVWLLLLLLHLIINTQKSQILYLRINKLL